MMPIVLATESRYKISLFQRLGLPFTTHSPLFAEEIISGIAPESLAVQFAEGKARSLCRLYPDHLIIGADQVLSLKGHILTKPGSIDRAVEQLEALCGRTHELHTAFFLAIPGAKHEKSGLVTSHLTFRSGLNISFLRYLAQRDETQDCVGGYKWERSGIVLVERMVSPDPNAIVGLPLIALTTALLELGFFVT